MGNEIWRRSALQLASDIKSGRTTSREVVQAHLDRIAEVNGHVNAVVKVLADSALAAADDADRAVRDGAPLGVFHGVPLTIKENIDVAGQPTTSGVPVLAGAIAPDTAPAVERMLAAGAIPIGRTNLPDMGLRIHTDSTLYGRTKNPWDPERTAGGSSGGEAAALATGMSPIGLGNDIGGSLRNPAHACGVASIKPSRGVVPDTQAYPTPDRSLSSQVMLNQGVMARTVADVRAGLETIAGHDPRDPVSVPARLTDLAPGERLRVAVLAEPPGGSTHPGVAAAVRAAADALSDAGHDVVEATPPDYELSFLLWAAMLFTELHDIRDQIDAVMGEGGRKLIANALDMFPKMSSLEYYVVHSQRDGVARRWGTWFVDHPVLLSPTWSQPAFVADWDISGEAGSLGTLELMRPVLPGNLLGLPCAVVPGGMADGLPVGVQVIGDRYTDLRVLSVAQQIEDARGIITPIDPR
ncbi:MAG: indole acetimide hydrolase [Actinobacteria bacterium]|jgi:amidase|nr:indole acetimide hydrolase [Actinomycetota bacterium]NBR66002.1 indole acetimide hydrolase [Actinomycetota bacterium]